MTTTRPTRRERLSAWNEKFVVEERYLDPPVRRRLYATSVVLAGVGLIAFLILLVGVLTHTGVQHLDLPVEKWFNAQRSKDVTGYWMAMAIVFGPVVLPIIVLVVVVVWMIAAKHIWRPVLLAAGMLTGVVTALVLAPIVKHPRPPVALMLLGPDQTYSFPSGHVLGTADFFLILAFLLASRIQRRWFTVAAFTLAIVFIAAQIFGRLYLGYHWISDTLASVALSLIVLGGVIALDTFRTVRVPGEEVEGELSRRQTDGT
jgi:undecaprenyl-diphosphatase